VTSIGHCHPRVVRVMQEQIATLVHASNLYFTRPQAVLAERLVRLTCAPGQAARQGFLLQQRRRSERGALQARAQVWQRRPAA
jgi:4-aminobutyrate aminotransferase-like enzyme